MATYTENYNLKKPSMDDFGDITDLNKNMDKIDEQMSINAHNITAVKQKNDEQDGKITQNTDDITAVKEKNDEQDGKITQNTDDITAVKEKNDEQDGKITQNTQDLYDHAQSAVDAYGAHSIRLSEKWSYMRGENSKDYSFELQDELGNWNEVKFGMFPQALVVCLNATSSYQVTAKHMLSSLEYNRWARDESEVITIDLPAYGPWDIWVTVDGERSVTQNVNIDTVKQYQLEFLLEFFA